MLWDNFVFPSLSSLILILPLSFRLFVFASLFLTEKSCCLCFGWRKDIYTFSHLYLLIVFLPLIYVWLWKFIFWICLKLNDGFGDILSLDRLGRYNLDKFLIWWNFDEISATFWQELNKILTKFQQHFTQGKIGSTPSKVL